MSITRFGSSIIVVLELVFVAWISLDRKSFIGALQLQQFSTTQYLGLRPADLVYLRAFYITIIMFFFVGCVPPHISLSSPENRVLLVFRNTVAPS